MADERPDLTNVRTQYQVPDDQIINYHPRAFGAIDIPFTSAVKVTKTEGALLDELTFSRGLAGLQDFSGIKDRAFSEGEKRFPNNPLPDNIPAERAREWQGNDGHRDAFRHAYWNALLVQQYGEQWTKAFATAHEGLPGNTANREAMDLYNNEIGRSIGAANKSASPEQLANLVEQSLNQGKLVVVDRNGSLEWSDRVVKGQHGFAPNEVIGPHLGTPGVVSPTLSYNAAPGTPGQPDTLLAAAQPSPNVERMQQDPMYGQVVTAMNAKGLHGDPQAANLAANIYAAAANERLSVVTNIEIGKQVNDANGNPDRNLFVFDGTNGPQGPNHARVSENHARNTPVEVAANNAVDARTQQAAALTVDLEPKKAVSMNV
jgi:hypothetical protein